MTLVNETKARKMVNKELGKLGNYHNFIPCCDIDIALESAGFKPMEPAIYCGREGNVIEQVGPKTYINLTWYKMESGRYEIVVYVS